MKTNKEVREFLRSLVENKELGLSKKISKSKESKDPLDSIPLSDEAIASLVVKTFNKLGQDLSVYKVEIPRIKSDKKGGWWHAFLKRFKDNSGVIMLIKTVVVTDKVVLFASVNNIEDVRNTSHWDYTLARMWRIKSAQPIWDAENRRLCPEDKNFLKELSAVPTIQYDERVLEETQEIKYWVYENSDWWNSAWARSGMNEVASDIDALARMFDETISFTERKITYNEILFNNFEVKR